MTNDTEYRYPWDRGKYGIVLLAFLFFLFVVVFWDIWTSEPLGYISIFIGIGGITLSLRTLIEVLRAPDKFTIRGNKLIVSFPNRTTDEFDISKIHRVVETKSKQWFSPYTMTIFVDERQIPVGRFLIRLPEFLDNIKRASPSCRFEKR